MRTRKAIDDELDEYLRVDPSKTDSLRLKYLVEITLDIRELLMQKKEEGILDCIPPIP